MKPKTAATGIVLVIFALLAVLLYNLSPSGDGSSGRQRSVMWADLPKNKAAERSSRAQMLAARVIKGAVPAAQLSGETTSPSAQSGDFDSALREGLRIHIQNNQATLKLTPAEVDQLIEDYLLFEEARALIESKLARTLSHADGELAIVIPAYPDAGRELKELFHEQLRGDFSAEKVAAINTYLGDYLVSVFRDFGAMNQTLNVARAPGQPTLVYWRTEREGPSEPGRVLMPSGTAHLSDVDLDGPRYRFIKSAFAAAEARS